MKVVCLVQTTYLSSAQLSSAVHARNFELDTDGKLFELFDVNQRRTKKTLNSSIYSIKTNAFKNMYLQALIMYNLKQGNDDVYHCLCNRSVNEPIVTRSVQFSMKLLSMSVVMLG